MACHTQYSLRELFAVARDKCQCFSCFTCLFLAAKVVSMLTPLDNITAYIDNFDMKKKQHLSLCIFFDSLEQAF